MAAVLFVFFLLLYGFTSRAATGSSDEIASFRTGVAFFTSGSLAIDDLKPIQKVTDIGQMGRGDHLYSKYFPGNALAAGLIYRLAARPGDTPYLSPNATYGRIQLAPSRTGALVALRLNALLAAMGLAMLALVLQGMFSRKTALTTVLLIGLTTDWWYESQLFYSEIGAGAFLIASMYFAARRKPYLCSLMFAASLLFRPTNIVALPIWLYAVWKDRPKALLSGIFIVGGLGLLALYNYVRFGSLFDFGYGGESFTTPILSGLFGLLFSPGHSFLFYSPITILGITGAPLLWNRNRPLALACLASVVGYILLISTWDMWAGGKVWGSRLLVPILPLTGVLIAAAIEQLAFAPTRRLLLAVVLLGAIGLGIQLLALLQNPGNTIQTYTTNGYATVNDSTWSLSKNWLALQIKSLQNWNVCHTGSYSLRTLLSQCRRPVIPP